MAGPPAQTRRGSIIPSDQLPPMPQPGEIPTEVARVYDRLREIAAAQAAG